MVQSRLHIPVREKPFDIWEGLKELSMFFQERDEVHKSMRRLVRRLKAKKITYAVAGGMAVFAHKYRRATNDIDILLSEESFAQFRDAFVPKNYAPIPERARRFTDRVNNVTIDVLIAGHFPGSGTPGPVAFPDPETSSQTIRQMKVIDLPTLIQLKLAARRHRDFGDVVELIRCNDLDETFTTHLHSSLHRDYIECLEEKRREDLYEARKG